MERIRVYLEKLKQGLQIDVLREVGRQYPVICFLLVFMLSSTILLNRYLHILMVFWSFLAGVITFYCSLGTESLLPNILFTMKPKNKTNITPRKLSAMVGLESLLKSGFFYVRVARVGSGEFCISLVQVSSFYHSFERFDFGFLSGFWNVCFIMLFITLLYRDITDDEACVDELRMTFRFFASVLVRRAQKVDVPSLISGKMMKAAMKHVEIIAKAKQKVKNTEGLQQAALDEYGPDLHVALRSRREELLYLRKMTEMLFAYLMPPKATDCRSLALLMREVMVGSVFLPTLDFVADPDTVNHMVLIFVDDSPPELAMDPPSALVPFLQKYADPRTKKTSVLKLELKEIREQQDLLFRFMNFLKQEGAVQVLQFCLTVEEFNDKILCPELSDSELQRLHGEVQHLYETYCLEESIDKISFDPFIIEEIRNIAQGPYEGVVKLQTMHCLFEAYEHVLSLLERVFTPMFCHSDEYFRHLLRGVESPKMDSRMNRNSLSLDDMRNISKRVESFGISRIGSKIKGVFKSTAMEGTMLPYAMVNAEDKAIEEATMVVEDNTLVEACSTPGVLRNLSAWSITIPYVDEVDRERVPVFCIEVERNDRKEVGHETENWSIFRRYMEFYVLENKLTEFHGSFADAQLPSKRIIGPKNSEFLSSKREEFEEYLQRLMQHPELSNSQLLADFLSPHSMESQFMDKMLPDVNLGKIFRSVPGKIIKEKGQNLEPFIQSFFNSCESPKAKPSRPEMTMLSPTAEKNKKLFTDLYKNNANLPEGLEKKHNRNCFMEVISVEGMYDYMMFMGRVVFHMPDWLHHILSGGRILFKNTLEAYMDNYIQHKLDMILQEHHVVSLVTMLRDAVFCETSEELATGDKQRRAKKAFEEMINYLPDFVEKCIGQEAKYEGIRLLFDGFQQPLLNKQMTYVLMDIAVEELFPELSKQGQREPSADNSQWM
uniref:Sorting nexin 14 n=1 Tax=Salmo trutta TaxID=8032 RepID=A0A674E927_SALTR